VTAGNHRHRRARGLEPPAKEIAAYATAHIECRNCGAQPGSACDIEHLFRTVCTERFAAACVNAVLVPAQVPVERFDKVIPALMALGNLDGLLVTVPFKARMLPFASRLGAAAECIGAVNALRREADGSWTGDMFDGEGFVRGIERKGERIRGRRVLMFGAGGAGSAIACALAGAGVESIGIVDPDAGRVEALAEALRNAFPDCDVAAAPSKAADVDHVARLR
jgi:shikimate dehydrogenase